MLNGATVSVNEGVVYPKISIVAPVFNSESKIPELYCRVKFTLEAMGAPFEMVLVEDCSSDDSWRVLGALARFDERVTALQLMRSSGKAAAALAGMSWAKGEVIVTIDDDLSYAPEDIPLLVHRLLRDEELDVVMGTHADDGEGGWLRRAGRALADWLRRRTGRAEEARFTGFRAMRRQAAEVLLTLSVPHPELNAMIRSITRRTANETVRPKEVIPAAGGLKARAQALAEGVGARLGRLVDGPVRPLHAVSVIGAAGLALSLAAVFGFLGLYFTGARAASEVNGLALIASAMASFNFLAFSLIARHMDAVSMIWSNASRWIVRRALHYQASQGEAVVVRTEDWARLE